jgi:hypothetical protein
MPGSLATASPSARPPMLGSAVAGVAPGPVGSIRSPERETWSPAAARPAAFTASGLPVPSQALPAGVAPAPPAIDPEPMAPAGIPTGRPGSFPATSFPAHLRVRASVRPGRPEAVPAPATATTATAAPAVEALPADSMDPRLERAMTEVLRRAARRQGIDV